MPFNPLTCTCGDRYYLPQRYVVCFYIFLGIVVAYSQRLSFNLALTTMVEKKQRNATECPDFDPPLITSGKKYRWSEEIQGHLLGAFYVGYFLMHIPAGLMSDIFGAKHTFAQGILIGALAHGLTPIAIEYGGMFMLYCLRFFIGMSQGALFPSCSVLLVQWVPANERGTVGSLVYTGAQVGSITGNAITGYIIAEFGGWPTQFYFWCIVSIVWWAFAMVFTSSRPSEHVFMTEKEKTYLEEQIGRKRKLKVPWKAVLLSKPVWALIFGQIGHLYIFFTVITYLPKYLKEVLKFNVKKTGFLMALPFIALWFAGWICGALADYLINHGKTSVLFIRNIFTFISALLPAICVVAAGYMGCNQTLATSMFILSMFTMGPFYPGMRVNNMDISKNFAGLVMALENGLGALSFIPAAPIIGVMTTNNTIAEWRMVYWMVFVISMIFTVIYNFMAEAERQQWDIDAELQED